MSLGGLFDFFHFQHAWELGGTRRWAQAAKQDEKNCSQLPYLTLGNTEGKEGPEGTEDNRGQKA